MKNNKYTKHNKCGVRCVVLQGYIYRLYDTDHVIIKLMRTNSNDCTKGVISILIT